MKQTPLLSLTLISLILFASSCQNQTVSVRYCNMLQFEIQTPGGHIIYLDARDDHSVSRQPKATDALASTNNLLFTIFWTGSNGGHFVDTMNTRFVDKFPGPQLHLKAGTISIPDAQIETVASARLKTQSVMEDKYANYIVIIKTAGLTIVYLGMFGQELFTPSQLAKVKNCDVLMMPFENQMSEREIETSFPPKWIEQIQPKLVIPTYYGDDLADLKSCFRGAELYYSKKIKEVDLSKTKIDGLKPGSILALDTILMANAKLYWKAKAF